MSTKVEPLIHLQFNRVVVLTTKEYEDIKRNLVGRAMIGDTTEGDRILAGLLLDNEYRYNECLQIKKNNETLG